MKKYKSIKWLLSFFMLCSTFTNIPAVYAEEENPELVKLSVDSTMVNGTLQLSTVEGEIGEQVTVTVKPEEGYRLKPGSLRYYNTKTKPTLIDEDKMSFNINSESSIKNRVEYKEKGSSFWLEANKSYRVEARAGQGYQRFPSQSPASSVFAIMKYPEQKQLFVDVDEAPFCVETGTKYNDTTGEWETICIQYDFKNRNIGFSSWVYEDRMWTYKSQDARDNTLLAAASTIGRQAVEIVGVNGYPSGATAVDQYCAGYEKIDYYTGGSQISNGYKYTNEDTYDYDTSPIGNPMYPIGWYNGIGAVKGNISGDCKLASTGASNYVKGGYNLAEEKVNTVSAYSPMQEFGFGESMQLFGSVYVSEIYYKDVFVTAEFELEDYSITTQELNGTITADKKIANINQDIKLSVAPNTGYFYVENSLRWRKANESEWHMIMDDTKQFTMPGSNVIVTAEFKPYKYTVSFDSIGGSAVEAKEVTYDAAYGALSAPKRAGYTFTGWYADIGLVTLVDASTIVKTLSDHTLYAGWLINPYNITVTSIDHATMTVDKAIANIDDVITVTLIPDEGYAYVAGSLQWQEEGSDTWNAINENTKQFVMPASDVTVRAEVAPIKYIVSFDSAGGSAVEEKEVTYDSPYGALSAPIRVGYTFTGWYAEIGLVTLVDASTIVKTSSNHTLYAGWLINPYSVTIKPIDHGTMTVDKAIANIDDVITVTLIPDEGYAYVAGSLQWQEMGSDTWHAINENTKQFVMPASDVVIVAAYSAIPFTIEAIPPVNNAPVDAVNLKPNKDIAIIGDTITIEAVGNGEYALVLGSIEYRHKKNPITRSTNTNPWIPVDGFTFTMPAADVEVRGAYATKQIIPLANKELRKAIIEEVLTYRIDANGKVSDPYNNTASEYYLYESERAFLNRITILDISNKQLKSLDGIESVLPNLVKLTANDNELTKFDITLQLEELYLNNNRLKEINVSHQTNLKVLSVNNNLLYSLDLTDTLALEQLQASSNSLANLDLSANLYLTRVAVSHQLIVYDLAEGSKTLDLRILNKDHIEDHLNVNIDKITFDANSKHTYEDGIVTFTEKADAIYYEYDTGHGLMDVTISLSFFTPNRPGGGEHSTNKIVWKPGDDGIRVSILNSDKKAVYVGDYATKQHDGFRYYGKISKFNYGINDRLQMQTHYSNHLLPDMPKVIHGDMTAIKEYYTSESTLREIARHAGIPYSELIGGTYEIALEPIIYYAYDNNKYAASATQVALYDKMTDYNQDGYGRMYELGKDIMHKALPEALHIGAVSSNQQYYANDFIINQLGIYSITFSKEEEDKITIIPSFDYKYRVATEVYTSFYLKSDIDRAGDNPIKVEFGGSNANCFKEVEIPAGKSQLVWCNWKTPSTPGQVNITIKVDGKKTLIPITLERIDNLDPPDTKADDKKPYVGWIVPKVRGYQPIDTMRWSVWEPKWIPEWEFKDNEGWIGKWSFYEKGTEDSLPISALGNVDKPYKRYYQVNLKTTVQLLHDPDNKTAEGNTMKSGYGVNIEVTNTVTGNGEHTGIQSGAAQFPEFWYDRYMRRLDGEAMMRFQPNKYDINKGRTHFTPLWFPDGKKYEVRVRVLDVWTPAGMLNTTTSDYKNIQGNIFDDWMTSKGNR